MKRAASSLQATNKRIKEEPDEAGTSRRPPVKVVGANGYHEGDIDELREMEEESEEMNDLLRDYDEKELESELEVAYNRYHEPVATDDDIATDPGQPLAVNLPVDILETVFAHLSVQDMMNCSLVCTRWSTICRREKFMFWKKSYLKLKRGKKWEEWDIENGITITHPATMECLMDTARFVQHEFTNKLLVDEGDEEKVSTSLSRHPQYTNVIGVLQRDRVLQHKRSTLLLPATVCLLVTLSRDVFEVRKVFLLLTAPGSPCCLMRVVELFYCIATFFYIRWRQQVLPQRYHYKVFHVLTLFEQPDLIPHRKGVVSLTHEQSRIVNHPIKPGDVVKVVAFAGTGKTTTLLHFALAHPKHRFLYLVYNKSVQLAASKLFPKRVDCKTFHALTHKYTGKDYDLSRSGVADLPEFLVDGKKLQKPKDGEMTAFELNLLANKTVTRFLVSADEEISSRHLPRLSHKFDEFPEIFEGRINKLLVGQAKVIWNAMRDLKDRCVMTHDGYLKEFQLLRPRPQETKYQCILIDESQDLSPAVLDILMHQNCPKIFVGDPHQQIYTFRGAINAIDKIEPTHSYYLTKSFRFGPNIAFLASVMLSELKSVHQQTLTGGLQDGGYYGRREEGQLAFIARTNGALISELFTVLDRSPNSKLAFAGAVSKNKFKTLEDVYFLKQDQKHNIRSPKIRKFKNFYTLKSHAEITEDFNLLQLVNICFKYIDIPRFIELVEQNGIMKCKDVRNADMVFSTAHSAKGLEFHTVKIANDYLSKAYSGPRSNEFRPNRCAVDERNLLYVAVTRATHYVILNTAAVNVLQLAREYPVLHCMPSHVTKTSDSCCNWRICALNPDDDIPLDPIIVPVNTPIPVHRISFSLIGTSGPLCACCINKYCSELSPL